MTTSTNKTVSHAKPKAATKKPSAAEKAKAAVEKMRQATLSIPMPEPVAEIMMLPIELVQVQKQVRTEFNEETIRELAEDIAERGVIQPILVRAIDGGYLVVAGERRYRAAKLAQLPTVPAIVSSIDDDTAAAVQIAENIQREDLSLADTAAAVRKLYELHGNSVTVTAEKLHKSKAWVSKHLAASCPKLNYAARTLIEDGITEDLEIVLTIDKISDIDFYEASKIAQQVREGKAGRETVRQRLEQVKIENEREKEEHDKAAAEWNSPEAVAKREAERKEQQEKRAAAEQEARLSAEYLVWRDVTNLDDDQRLVLREHLDAIAYEGKTAGAKEMRLYILQAAEDGGVPSLELAAYLAGYTGQSYDLNSLQNEIREAHNGDED